MSTKLRLYNGALRLVGERKLTSLTENRDPRRFLDEVWDDGFINLMLSTGQWMFACRTQSLTYSPSVTPAFGYQYAFDKPADWIRTISFSGDEYFAEPLLRYQQQALYWFADVDTIYIRYVSNDTSYGGVVTTWPENFCQFVEAHLAREICSRLEGGDTKRKSMDDERSARLSIALSTDAMEEPTRIMPMGNWAGARMSGRGWRGR